MPERDPSTSPEPPGAAHETRNLPVPIPQSSLVPHQRREGWLVWALRVILGWKAGSIRANLTDVLRAGADETGFSPKESVMLQNILGLRERRGAGVMVSRAGNIAGEEEIALAALLKMFARAPPFRLASYARITSSALRNA